MTNPQSPFDVIRHEDDQGEYWLARELAKALGYELWQNFRGIVKVAQKVYLSQGGTLTEGVFIAINKNPTKAGGRPSSEYDYRLTRHACYLVALSAEGSKNEVAAAKTYFAVKTRQQEEDELLMLDDPESALDEWKERAIRSFMAKGYSLSYATNRVANILSRKNIEDKWVLIGITDEEIGILTNQMHMGTFGLSVDAHKGIKGFPEVRVGRLIRHKGNLRPALTPMESAVMTFAENVTLALHDERDTHGFGEASRDVDDGSAIARDKRLEIERITGRPVVSSRNMLKSPDGGIFGDIESPENERTEKRA